MPTLTGTVTSGCGAATHDVNAGVYPIDGLYPGSLNLETALPDLPAPAVVVDYAGIVRCLWPARTGQTPVWLMVADQGQVELLASVRLRDTLGLDDGDLLIVEV